jgi:hypothetical protein
MQPALHGNLLCAGSMAVMLDGMVDPGTHDRGE